MYLHKRSYFAILFVGAVCTYTGNTQEKSIGAFSAADAGVKVPKGIVKPGQKDPSAILEITLHLRVVGNSSPTGIQATGTITYPSTKLSNLDATLSLLRSDCFRLDVVLPNGTVSTRINGIHGAFQDTDSKLTTMPFDTAASGLFQFPMLRALGFTDSVASVEDRGMQLVDKHTLHLITIESTGHQLVHPGRGTSPPNPIDLYFDPDSHLLVKSATIIRIAGQGNQDFLRVVSYSDYRKVADALIPFGYSESLNGQPQWILRLTQATYMPSLTGSYFTFSGASR